MVGLMVALSAHGGRRRRRRRRRRRERLGEPRRSVDDERQDESSGEMLERGHLKAGASSKGTKRKGCGRREKGVEEEVDVKDSCVAI
jgi:hypothetical protein